MTRAGLPYGRPWRTLAWLVLLAAIVPFAWLLFWTGTRAPLDRPDEPPAGDETPWERRPGRVTGVVTDSSSRAVEGVTVTVHAGIAGAIAGSARTGDDGVFVIEGIGADRPVHTVTARRGPLQASVELESEVHGSLAEGVVLRLLLPLEFSVAGVVLDAPTRAPVAGAHVICAGRTANTDFRGAFEIAGLPTEAARDLPLLLEIEIEGFRPQRKRLPAEWLPGRYSDVQVLLEPAR